MKENVNGEEYLSKLTHMTLNNLCPGLPYNMSNETGSERGHRKKKEKRCCGWLVTQEEAPPQRKVIVIQEK